MTQASPKKKGRSRQLQQIKSAQNVRRAQRRVAIRSLIQLAKEVHQPVGFTVKTATTEELDALVDKLSTRCQTRDRQAALYKAAKTYADKGGLVSNMPAPPPDPEASNDEAPAGNEAPPDTEAEQAPPAPLTPKHRALQAGQVLHSRAFMLTYNSSAFSENTWADFKKFTKELKTELHARAWTACWEKSLHSAEGSDDEAEPSTERCHGSGGADDKDVKDDMAAKTSTTTRTATTTDGMKDMTPLQHEVPWTFLFLLDRWGRCLHAKPGQVEVQWCPPSCGPLLGEPQRCLAQVCCMPWAVVCLGDEDGHSCFCW